MEQHTFKRRGLGLSGVDEKKVAPGYVLYAPLTANTVHLIDIHGKEVKKWTLPYRNGRHARLLADGVLAVNSAHPQRHKAFPMWAKYRGGVMTQLDAKTGNVLREYRDPWAHHDQNHLDDGTILYTTLEALTPEKAATVQGGVPGSEGDHGIIYADVIRWVDPWKTSNTSSSNDFEGEGTGGARLLWEWHLIDHLDTKRFPLNPYYAREHYTLINSVSFTKTGDIIASLRSASAVIIISRSTGEVIWDIGSPIVNQQHCAHELPDGNILVFDNGAFRKGVSLQFSTAVVISRETKEVVWQWKDASTGGIGFYTPFMGSAQRLPNGNTLIVEAATGRIIEVTADKELVWEFVAPQLGTYAAIGNVADDELDELLQMGFSYPANAIFRAYKYTPEECSFLD